MVVFGSDHSQAFASASLFPLSARLALLRWLASLAAWLWDAPADWLGQWRLLARLAWAGLCGRQAAHAGVPSGGVLAIGR